MISRPSCDAPTDIQKLALCVRVEPGDGFCLLLPRKTDLDGSITHCWMKLADPRDHDRRPHREPARLKILSNDAVSHAGGGETGVQAGAQLIIILEQKISLVDQDCRLMRIDDRNRTAIVIVSESNGLRT